MVAGSDYAQQTLSLNDLDDQEIRYDMRTICYNQSIYDDLLPEGSEYFGLSLVISRATVLTRLRPMYDQAAILIGDNDHSELYDLDLVSYLV